MKYLLFFFSISCIYACNQISRQKGNQTEILTDEPTITKENKDSLILITKTDGLDKQIATEEIKLYKKQPDIVPTAEPNTDLKKGSYLSLPEGEPANYKNISNVIIENLQFTNKSGTNLLFINCKYITIRNCYFGRSGGEAIVLEECSNIRIEKCLFAYNLTGVYAASSSTIKVINNQFVNVRMREGGSARGQFVQFNNVTGEGNEISNNKGENFPGESNPEDCISMFKSSGTATSPICINNNIFRGGGPSASGGGIVLGDHGGRFIIAENNTLLNPGQYGIAVAGGSNMTILNNKIYAKQQPFTNNPLFVWAQANVSCSDIIVKGNRASWVDKKGNINGGWNAGNCKNTSFEYPAPITEAEMNIPGHLIDFVTPDELLKIRRKK
ncbi:MAG TPA: right-handed parallel beta-helix repeat-containing protein [Chitinophagaceae bacterium]|nr:right-handed parallel beta-helix repeat-containing protein [Chitinophagaceae bacterium]